MKVREEEVLEKKKTMGFCRNQQVTLEQVLLLRPQVSWPMGALIITPEFRLQSILTKSNKNTN